MEETWKDVKAYEGLYMVSESGLVKRLVKTTKMNNQYGVMERVLPEMIMKHRLTKKGYPMLRLTDNSGNKKGFFVHTIVAAAFLEYTKPNQVNHKDGNKQNNHVSNLEIVTQSENMQHMVRYGKGKQVYITFIKRFNKFKVIIPIPGTPNRVVTQEYFKTEQDAIKYRDAKISEFGIKLYELK